MQVNVFLTLWGDIVIQWIIYKIFDQINTR